MEHYNKDCLFCKIILGEVPSKKVYENEYVYAFEDINPIAPVHILIIPKLHIKDTNDIDTQNSMYLSEIMKSIKEVAKIYGIDESGYRIVSNCGKDANQVVPHLHFHLLGGKKLGDYFV